MKRNTRLFIVMGIAVVTAALASLGVYEAIVHRPPPPPDPKIDVVVAAQPLERGKRLTAQDVKVIPWPKRIQIAGAFAKVEDVVNGGLIVPVVENEPITDSKLAGDVGILPKIRPGLRALSVKVNEVIGVAGFVTPGTLVDVIVTLRQSKGSRSRVVVSNVEVLTAGTKYDDAQAKKDGKPIPSSVVTLIVLPEDAERIALAASEGQIMLALRNPLDTAPTRTPGAGTEELMGQPALPKPSPRNGGVKPPPPPSPSFRIITKCIGGKCTDFKCTGGKCTEQRL